MGKRKVNLKQLKPVPKMQDPIRYPKVTGKIEEQSKDSFEHSLKIEGVMLKKMMEAIIE